MSNFVDRECDQSSSHNGGNHIDVTNEKDGALTVSDIEDMLRAVIGPIRGSCSDGEGYDSLAPLWETQLINESAQRIEGSQLQNDTPWYTQAYQYWEDEENCPTSDDGVLGGFGSVTPMDSRDSHAFIDSLIALRPGILTSLKTPTGRPLIGRAADCGAGIGRVSKHVLLHRCSHVDLVEQSPRLLNAAPEYLLRSQPETPAQTMNDFPADSHPSPAYNAENFSCINLGLQDFVPAKESYDLIWVQWVIGHLHDLDFIQFLRHCAMGLRQPDGVIVLKDNMLFSPSRKEIEEDNMETMTFAWDKEDSSVTRHIDYVKLLVALAGLKIIQQQQQSDFPEDLYPVVMMTIAKGNQ